MPLWKNIDLPFEGALQIWDLQENESFFLEKLNLYPEEEEQVLAVKGRRRLEWLSSRYLITQLIDQDGLKCIKDQHGKPYLSNHPFHISISHSRNLVATMVSPYPIGLDIQFLVQKIHRISRKFISSIEHTNLEYDSLRKLHVYWGAKEAMYKGYGRRQLDFIQNLYVAHFDITNEMGKTHGAITKPDEYQKDFDVYYQFIEELCLVFVKEKDYPELLND